MISTRKEQDGSIEIIGAIKEEDLHIIRQILESKETNLIFDLSQISASCSLFLGLLASACKNKKTIGIKNPSPYFLEIIKNVGLDKIFTIIQW
jgi:anti-anti-sigma regulatory factor